MGTKNASFADTSKSDIPLNLGIYKGIVKKIDTATRNGRIYVFVDGFGSDNADLEASWKPMNYASPFSGFTSGPIGASKGLQVNSYSYTQQTYGFTIPSLDIGSQVLCCFPSGDTQEGYWFACVNPNLSRYMEPALGALDLSKIDPVSIPSDVLPYLKPGTPYPVGEFNQFDSKVYTSNWNNSLRPLNIPQTLNLVRQGLDSDPNRGAISSSLQRDPLNSVFGFSTPGRPISTQDPQNIPDLRQKLSTGDFNPTDFNVTTRVGGHSFVMDDGDLYGKNNLTRWKTAAGHQILMNDSDGFIYISNSTGTTWIELTAKGDVLIYAGNDLSIRTQGNLMMHSDQNIKFNAGRSFNVYASESINLQSPRAIQTNAGQILNLYGGQTQMSSQGGMSIGAGGSFALKASGAMHLNASTISLNGGGGSSVAARPGSLPTYSLPDAKFTDTGWAVVNNFLHSTNYRVPTHEPYIRGNVAALVELQEQLAQESTTIADTDIAGTPISPPAVTGTAGADQASFQSVADPAPTAYFIEQPNPGQALGVLDADQTRAYLAQVSYNASGGDYAYTGADGRLGKYQLDATTLTNLGYVNAGTTNADLSNPNVWTGKNDVNSASDFQTNTLIQDQAAYDYAKKNYASLQASGLIKSDTSADTVSGLLAASHSVGATATTSWYTTGEIVTDNVGTSVVDSFNRGRYSQTQVPLITASETSKQIVVNKT
jgi:hypothetical protein